MIILFIGAFQLSEGPLAWIYFAEVCNDSAMGVVLAGLFGTMVVMSFTVSYMIDSPLGFVGTFWIYAGFNILAALYTIFVLKETKDKTPAQLKALYLPANKVKATEVESVELAN